MAVKKSILTVKLRNALTMNTANVLQVLLTFQAAAQKAVMRLSAALLHVNAEISEQKSGHC